MSDRIQHKSVAVEANAYEDGAFAAYASIFGNTDRGGDRMMPGSFKKTLNKWRASGRSIPIVVSHKWDDLTAYVGEAGPHDVYEDDRGLIVQGKLWLDEPEGRKVHKLMKSGLLTGWSFGYRVPPGGSRRARDGANEITEVELFEAGPTLVGMNPEAQLQAVKSEGTIWISDRDGNPQAVRPSDEFWWETDERKAKLAAEVKAAAAQIEAEEVRAAQPEFKIPMTTSSPFRLEFDGRLFHPVDLRHPDSISPGLDASCREIPSAIERRRAEEAELRRRQEIEERNETQRREAAALLKARRRYAETATVNIAGQRVHPSDVRFT